MTELRSILTAIGRSTWNLGWRFSQAKSLLWRTLLGIGIGLLVAWRLGGQLPAVSPHLPLLVIAVEGGLVALVSGFMRGRQQLFDHRSAALIYLSPAPTWAVLGGRLLATVPGRLGSALLLTVITLQVLPVERAILWAPLMVVTGVTTGLLGQLAGNLGLIGWARFSPKTIGLTSILGLIMAITLAWGIAGIMAAGAPLADLIQQVERLRDQILIGLGLVILLPGLALGLALLFRPAWVGDLYRSAYLAIAEASEAAYRPHRSWLPRPFASPAWAIGMKEWRQLGRNRLNYFRGSLLGLLVIAIALLDGRQRQWANAHADLVALLIGVGGTWLAFAEVVGALCGADEERAELLIVSGLTPVQYLGGKLLGALPFVLIAGVATAITGWLLGGPALALGGIATGLFLGAMAAVIGPATAGFNARPSPWQEVADTGLNLREQLPSDLGSWIGVILSLLLSGGGILLAPGAPVLAVLITLGGGALALLAGLPTLNRLLVRGRTE